MKRTILTFVLAITPLLSQAQITLEECQRKAREHYPEIAQYDLIALSEKYDIATASRGWIPQISLSAQASWQNNVVSFPDSFIELMKSIGGQGIQGMAKDQYHVALDVNQVIWDGGVSKHSKTLAKAEADEERRANDSNIYALEERINNLFFGILLLDSNYKVAESSLEILQVNLDKINSMYKNGAVLKSEVDILQVEIISMKQNMEQNRASRSYYDKMLELFIGEKPGELVKPVEVIVPTFVNMRPELALLDAKISTLNARENLLKSTLTPKFSFFAQGYYGNPGYDMFKAMETRDWTMNVMLGIRMQWNISPFFTYSSDKKKIDNRRNMLYVRKQSFEFNSNIQLAQQSGEIQRMRKSLDSDLQIMELRADIRKTAESQFEHGTIDTATLLERIHEETVAKNMFNIHEIELLKTEYELRHTINQ